MAWDTEATRRRLLAAGGTLFALHGFAGTSMDAIGRESGVNKERVYQYFGSKAAFFTAVLDDRLSGLLAGMPVEGEGVAAVGAWAEELFDRLDADPGLARLLAWESLELPVPVSAETRAAVCAVQAAGVCAALPGCDRRRAEHLLLSIVVLVASWWTLSRVADTILTVDASDRGRRRELGRQVEVLAADALRAG